MKRSNKCVYVNDGKYTCEMLNVVFKYDIRYDVPTMVPSFNHV